MLQSCKLIVTFESVEENPWCYHSNDFSSAVFSHSEAVFVFFRGIGKFCVELRLGPLLEVKRLINRPNSGLGSKRQSINHC